MSETKDVKDAVLEGALKVIEKLDKKVNDLEAKMRKYSANWKRFVEKYVDPNSGGEVGSVRISAMILVLAMATGIFAANQWSLQRIEDDSLNTIEVDSEGTLTVVANEDTDAEIILSADQADNDADTWKIYVDADDSDTIKMATYTSGSYADVFELTTAGALTTITVTSGGTNYGGDITLENDEVIENGTDGTVSISTDGTSEDLIFYNYTAKQNGTVTWKSRGDNGDDAGDTFGIENDGAGNLTIQADAPTKGTLADKVIISSVGHMTLADDLIVSGNDIDSSAATMTLGKSTATRVEIADTTIITDIEGPLSCAETAAFIGVATFTGKPILNGGITINEEIGIAMDANDEEITIVNTSATHTEAGPFITITDSATGTSAQETDEATLEINSLGVYALSIPDGAVSIESVLDADGAALSLGPALATSVEIGASGIDTTVLGPLNVLEATGKGIDTTGAGALHLGESVATSVVIADTTVLTDVKGTLSVDEAATFDSTVALDGATTCTNLTVDAGATLALLGVSVTWTNTGSITVDGTVAATTNQTFLSATGVTNTMVIVDGLIKAIN